MKILIDARLYGLEHAGLGRYTKNLVDELVKLDSTNSYILVLKNKYFDRLKLPSNWKKVRCDTKHYTVSEQFALAKIIYSERPDLVHAPNNYIPVFSFVPVVLTIHDLLMSKNRGLAATTLSPLGFFSKVFASKLLFRFGLMRAKKIIVPSRFVKDELISSHISSKKIASIYEGVTALRTSSKVGLNTKYFVYVGNAYPHKNLELLIKAASMIHITLALATSRGVFEDRLKKLIKKHKAEMYIKLLGFVPDDELGSLYKNAIAFVYPSTYEGFGLQGLEVMSAGGLVLASDIDVFKEIYANNALYFDPKDTESLKSTMQKALEMSADERLKRANAAKKFSEQYSWAKMTEQTLEVYKNSL